MSLIQWLNNEKIRLGILILLSAMLRILFILHYDNTPGDALGHVERAFAILHNPDFVANFDGNSSTLYKYSLAAFMSFWRDPILAARVFTLVFGILLVLPYYKTIEILFDRRIAFFSTLVLVFYPLHIIQSSITSSDAVYYFFLFSSFYYAFMFKFRQERVAFLALSALLFNIASLLRFECWILIPFMSLLFWKKDGRAAGLFVGLAAICPLVWLFLNLFIFHEIFYTFRTAGMTAHAEIMRGSVPYIPGIGSWLIVLWRSSGPSLVIGGLLGIAWAIYSRRRFELAVFFLVLLLAFTINSCLGRMWHHERYSIFLALLLIPYGWFFVDKLSGMFTVSKRLFFIVFLIFPMLNFTQFVYQPTYLRSILQFAPREIKDISEWLKANVRPDEAVVIDHDPLYLYSANILLHSGILPNKYFILQSSPAAEKWPEYKGSFEKYFMDRRPGYFILHSQGSARNILNIDLDDKGWKIGQVGFKKVFEIKLPTYGRYVIYRVVY